MPVLQKRLNKETFSEVLERMQSRLSGWKSKCLSFAGRMTLTKAVLSSIPVHVMSTICLPQSTLEKFDQLSRTFLWGEKKHVVAWQKVTVPKSEGGLGIARRAKDMNKALISKLGWRLLHDKDSLWAKLLRKKYKVGELQDNTWLVKKSNWSSTWRSIATGLSEVIGPDTSWVLGDGRKVRFWLDLLLFNKRLVYVALRDLPLGYETVLVRDMWRDGQGWDLHSILPFVSVEVGLELRAVVLDNVTGARDKLSWGESDNGEFSVKSAYAMITREEDLRPNMGSFFRRVWTVVVPERARLFLWMVSHQVIMSNAERHRRHLCTSNLCQVCKSGVKSILHVLRDCPAIAGVWNRLLPSRRRNLFFDQSLFEWVYSNLGDDTVIYGSNWATVFVMVVWWAWKWRCDNVFQNHGKCRDHVKFIKDLAEEVTSANTHNKPVNAGGARVEVMVGWKAPPSGWLKLNMDGASHGNPGRASARGVLRDEYGEWRGEFALHIGRCTALLAELWGVYYRLYIAWEQRVTRLELEVDSKVVVGFLQAGISDSHPLSFLVRLCHDFLSRDWIVQISHVYKEANYLADELANYAFSLPLGFHALPIFPPEVESLLNDDVIGSTRPRQIRL